MVGVTQIEEGDAAALELLRHVFHQGARVGVDHVVERHQGRDAQADAVGAEHFDGGIHHLKQQARAVFQRTAVLIGAIADAVAQELVEQIAVGAVHLHRIEAGIAGILGGGAEQLDDAGQLADFETARRRVVVLALQGLDLAVADRLVGGRHRLQAVIEQGVRGAARMPDLQGDAAAGGVHRVGDFLPAHHLLRAVDARLGDEGRGIAGGHGGLGDDQPGAGALRVILRDQIARHVLRLGAAARQRRHHHPVGQFQRASLERRE